MIKLLEKWPWDRTVLKLYIIFPILTSLLLIGLLYPDYGNYSLAVLLTIPTGLTLYFRFAPICKQINTLLGCISAQNGEAIAARLVINKTTSPGIVILRKDVIILIPVTGRRRKLQLSDIRKMEQTYHLPDKRLISKTVFIMETQTTSQYTFAVPRSTGNRWSNKFPNVTRNAI